MIRFWIIAFLFGASPLRAEEPPTQPTPFSTAKPGSSLPRGWALETLPKVPRATRFDLVQSEGRTVLRASSEAAAATLAHRLRVEPADWPRLAWRWRVSRVLQNADLTTKAGDDYAARLYVLFDYPAEKLSFGDRVKIGLVRTIYGQELPAAALCYVWDNRHPVGMSTWSAYTDRVRMIVVESGTGHAGQWRDEQRNLANDFRAAFGEEPPPVSGIALAADTDNTGESVTAFFGDVAFLPRPESKRTTP